MGLDTVATKLGKDGAWEVAPDEPFEGIRLCGGLFSGGSDSSSIRGKVYAKVVDAATGESLYEERIEPERVSDLARRLRAAVEEAMRAGTHAGRPHDPAWDGIVISLGNPDYRPEDDPSFIDVAGREIHAPEAEHLARWFEVCAEHGYAVEGRY